MQRPGRRTPDDRNARHREEHARQPASPPRPTHPAHMIADRAPRNPADVSLWANVPGCQGAGARLTLVRRVVNNDPTRIRAKPTAAPIVSDSGRSTTPGGSAQAG